MILTWRICSFHTTTLLNIYALHNRIFSTVPSLSSKNLHCAPHVKFPSHRHISTPSLPCFGTSREMVAEEQQQSKVAPPILDLAPFLVDGDQQQYEKRAEVMKLMRKACHEYGLFQVINHGVDPMLLNKVLKNAQDFYSRSLEEKLICKTDKSPFGFVHQSAAVGGSRDKKEHFFCSMEDNPACKHNVWPQSPPDFRSDALKLGKQMQKASRFLMTVLSRSLGLEEDVLSKAYEPTQDYLNILSYPAAIDYDGVILAKHQDGTIFTLVAQLNQVAGYQVFKDDEWYTVMPEKDALIVNIGDLLQASSNGKCKSAIHRVVANKKHRYSFVYSHLPCHETQICPLPEFTVDEPPRYRAFKQGEYLELRMENKKLDTKLTKEITIEHYAI